MSKFTDGFDDIKASEQLKEKTLGRIRTTGGVSGSDPETPPDSPVFVQERSVVPPPSVAAKRRKRRSLLVPVSIVAGFWALMVIIPVIAVLITTLPDGDNPAYDFRAARRVESVAQLKDLLAAKEYTPPQSVNSTSLFPNFSFGCAAMDSMPMPAPDDADGWLQEKSGSNGWFNGGSAGGAKESSPPPTSPGFDPVPPASDPSSPPQNAVSE